MAKKGQFKLKQVDLDRIIHLISEGCGVGHAANELGVRRRLIYEQRQLNTEFDEAYRSAYIFSVENAISESKVALENAGDRVAVMKYKELLKHAEWEAEKLLKHYQPIQKVEMAHTGPMVIGWENANENCPKCGHNMTDVTPLKLIEGDVDGTEKGGTKKTSA